VGGGGGSKNASGGDKRGTLSILLDGTVWGVLGEGGECALDGLPPIGVTVKRKEWFQSKQGVGRELSIKRRGFLSLQTDGSSGKRKA